MAQIEHEQQSLAAAEAVERENLAVAPDFRQADQLPLDTSIGLIERLAAGRSSPDIAASEENADGRGGGRADTTQKN